MKKILSILLILSFFSYQSYHSLIYLNYYINKSYYTYVLCENKDNPEKPHCNGKCHLKKQLDQQKPVEKQQHPFSKPAQISFYPELIAVLLSQLDILNHTNFHAPHQSLIHSSLLSPHLGEIFHPPKYLF
jgi:hypothetical protein